MHACGHDVHLAGSGGCRSRAAATLDLPRPLAVLLQPREEGVDSGAKDVVDEGGLEGVDAVVAAHVQPRVDAGVIAVTPGPVNAAIDTFRVTVTGRGGHSGYPHTVDDSVLALSAVVVAPAAAGRPPDRPDRRGRLHGHPAASGHGRQRRPRGRGRLGHGPHDAARGPRDRSPGDRGDRDVGGGVATAAGPSVTIGLGEPVLVNDVGLALRAGAILTELGHSVRRRSGRSAPTTSRRYCESVRGLMVFVGTGAERGGLHDASYLPDDAYVASVADALVAGYCAALTP